MRLYHFDVQGVLGESSVFILHRTASEAENAVQAVNPGARVSLLDSRSVNAGHFMTIDTPYHVR